MDLESVSSSLGSFLTAPAGPARHCLRRHLPRCHRGAEGDMVQPLNPGTARPSRICRGSTQRCPHWRGAHIASPPAFCPFQEARRGRGGQWWDRPLHTAGRWLLGAGPVSEPSVNDPQKNPGFESHPRLQPLTPMGCRDFLGFGTELAHKDLSRFKDAPARTQVGSAGGFSPPVPCSGVFL